MTTATVRYSWRVYCADGVRRHSGDFATRQAAAHWAQWQHACFNGHRFVRVPTGELVVDLTGDDGPALTLETKEPR